MRQKGVSRRPLSDALSQWAILESIESREFNKFLVYIQSALFTWDNSLFIGI